MERIIEYGDYVKIKYIDEDNQLVGVKAGMKGVVTKDEPWDYLSDEPTFINVFIFELDDNYMFYKFQLEHCEVL